MKTYLVIDGYNVLYASADYEDIQLNTYDIFLQQRERLISRCQNHAAMTGYDTLIVFDAYKQDEPIRSEKRSGIEIVYTAKDQTADSFMERYLYELPRSARKIAVTSDASIQNLASMVGAERIPSLEFIRALDEGERKQKDEGKSGIHHKNHLLSYMDDQSYELLESIRRGELLEEKTPEPKKKKKRIKTVQTGPVVTARLSDLAKLEDKMAEGMIISRQRRLQSLDDYEPLDLQKQTRGKQISKKEKKKRRLMKKAQKKRKSR